MPAVLPQLEMFACTRWTNLYFPGDFVGGPLAPLFGRGVEDRRVRDNWLSLTPLSHTRYRSQPTGGAKAGQSFPALRSVLALDCKDWIG